MSLKRQDFAQRAQRSPRHRKSFSSLCGRCGLGAIFAIVFVAFTADIRGADVAKKSPDLPEDLRRGLVLYYDFETRPVGDKITDLSGYKNDGKAVSVEWVADEQRGGAMKIGPTNSHITVPNNDSLNPAKLTLACWINKPTASGATIFDKNAQHGFLFTINRPLQSVFIINGADRCRSEISVADGKWHHLVATFDGEKQRVYVDGAPSGNVLLSRNRPERNTDDLAIGQQIADPLAGAVGKSLDATLDDVMMFNRALSANEVQALFKLQGGQPSSSPAARPQSTPSHAPAPEGPSSPADRIREIKQLLERGEIKQEEHDRRVKEILDAI